MKHLTRLLLLVMTAATLPACDSEEMDPEPLRCDDEPRAQAYVPGMIAAGEEGVYDVVLVESVPGPPTKGDSSWLLEIVDHATSAPVSDATITVVPTMPDHGHGTPVQTIITPAGKPGQFQVDQINLWMPGFWEVVIGVDAGGVTDEAAFGVCIEG